MLNKFAIKRYANKLLPTLNKRYGTSEKYSAHQIRETIFKCGFNPKYLPLAYILYIEKEQLIPILAIEYPELDITSFRKEICYYLSTTIIQTSFENLLVNMPKQCISPKTLSSTGFS